MSAEEAAAHLRQAEEAARAGRWVQATNECARALKIHPYLPTAWCLRGEAMSKLGRSEDALKCFERALKLDVGAKSALYAAACLLVEMRRHDEARQYLGRFRQVAGPEDSAKVKALRMLLIAPKYGELEEKKESALDAAAEAYAQSGTLGQAMMDAVLGSGEPPPQKPGLIAAERKRCEERAKVFMRNGNAEGALKCHMDALKVAPGDPEFVAGAADCLIRLGRAAEAVPFLEESTRRDGKRVEIWFQLGNALRAAGRPQDAAGAYDHAIRTGNHVHSWYRKGLCLRDLGRFAEARDCLDQAVHRAPRHADSIAALALVCAELGEADEALRLAERALRIDPKNPQATAAKIAARKETPGAT